MEMDFGWRELKIPGGMDPAAGLEDGRKGLGFISLEASPSPPSRTFGVCASGL